MRRLGSTTCGALAGAALAGLLLMSCGGGSASGPTTVATLPAEPTTAGPTTAAAPEPTSPTAPSTSTSVTATIAPPVTTPPAPGNPFVGDQVSVTSEYMPAPFTLDRLIGGPVFDLYEGTSTDVGLTMRCVVAVRPGDSSWHEWCSTLDFAGSFIVVDGADPWLVDVGVALGEVVITPMPSDWTLVSNGCSQSIVALITAAELGPAVSTGVVCVGDEAFMTFGSVFLQPGPVDGGGLLLIDGPEGWNTDGGGTSISCSGWDDGVDRCALFEVTDELFEASLPYPPAAVLAAQENAVSVRDDTAAIAQASQGAATTQGIVDAVTAALTDSADEEARPGVTAAHGRASNAELLVVEVPLLDDSTGSSTWAVWIRPDTIDLPAIVGRSFAWDTCSRGVVDDPELGKLCV